MQLPLHWLSDAIITNSAVKNQSATKSTSLTDRNSADPSAFSDKATSANLLVRDRAMSEKRLLSADCGTLQSVSRNRASVAIGLHHYQHNSTDIHNKIFSSRKPLVICYHCQHN